MSVDGMNKYGRRLRINFGIPDNLIMGTISMTQRIDANKDIRLKPQTKIINGYFSLEQLREIRREISRILLKVELKHKKERSKK